MKQKLTLFTLFILLYLSISAQFITVTGTLYHPNASLQTLLISQIIRNPVDNSFNHLYEFIPDKKLAFKSKVFLEEPGLYWLNYGGKATKIFLSPGDSINIIYSKLAKVDTIITAGGYETSKTKLVLGGNNIQQLTFFDSLEKKTGNFVGKDYNIDFSSDGWEMKYKDSIKLTYENRVNYLKKYSTDYHLSKEFLEVAKIEIDANYLSALIAAVYHEEKTKFPADYFEEIDNENFTWNKYKKSNTYSAMVYTYISHYLNWENIGIGTKEENLLSIYNGITIHLKDDSIRNFHLTYLMSTTLEKHPDNYEEYLEKYKRDCSNKNYVTEIVKAYDTYMAKYNNVKFSDHIINQTIFKSSSGQFITLKQLLAKHKPLLLDFWASWCGPCLMEMPISQMFAKKYKGKIEFAFISIDKNDSDWNKASTNLIGNQFLLKNERKSEFAKFLKLTYVPRYVLINADGKIVVFKGVQPTNPIAFEKMLNDNIKQ